MAKAVRYTQPLLGKVPGLGYLKAVPGASVLIRQGGVALDGAGGPSPAMWSDNDRTAALNNPIPTGVAVGAAGLDTKGTILVYLAPGRGYDALVTVGDVTTTVPLPDLSPDVDDVQRPAPRLVSPSGLRRFRASLADALNTPCIISCFGDSITEGRFANTANNNNTELNSDAAAQRLWRDWSWPYQLRRLFQRQYGDIGEGLIKLTASAQNFDPRITYSGTVNNTTVGAMGGVSFSTPAYIEISLPACTSFEIFWSWIVGTSGDWTYTVDGGSPVTVTAASNALFTTVVSGLAYGTHTLRILAGASGRADIGNVCAYKATAGVQVNRLGTGGGTIDLLGGLTPTNLVSAAYFTAPRAKLNILMWGYNDWNNQVGYGTGLGNSPTNYKAKLKVATDYITGTSGGCALLIPDPYGTTTDVRPFTQADYTAKMREIAAENDHVAFVDFNPIWGTHEAVKAAGLRADFVHPNRQGFGDIARLIYSVLTRPDLGN